MKRYRNPLFHRQFTDKGEMIPLSDEFKAYLLKLNPREEFVTDHYWISEKAIHKELFKFASEFTFTLINGACFRLWTPDGANLTAINYRIANWQTLLSIQPQSIIDNNL